MQNSDTLFPLHHKDAQNETPSGVGRPGHLTPDGSQDAPTPGTLFPWTGVVIPQWCPTSRRWGHIPPFDPGPLSPGRLQDAGVGWGGGGG